jgi:hypothetical protein
MTTPSTAPRRGKALLGLIVALPLAAAAHGWETAGEWWQAKELFAVNVPTGQDVEYGGGVWRLEKLSKLATRQDRSVIALVELKATVSDPEAFKQLPCSIALTNTGQPAWLPSFLSPTELRKARPDVAELPTCGVAKVGEIAVGSTVRMAETFRLPADAFERVRLKLSLPTERPNYLLFDR